MVETFLEPTACDDDRAEVVKKLAAQYPNHKWRVQLADEGPDPLPDEAKSEFFYLNHLEARWSLPAAGAPPDEPIPGTETVQLRLAYNMTLRAGPGTTFAPVGSLLIGALVTVTKVDRPTAGSYYWRRIFPNFQGKEAWIAERTLTGSTVYLVDPL